MRAEAPEVGGGETVLRKALSLYALLHAAARRIDRQTGAGQDASHKKTGFPQPADAR
jgi:hypothetical protein